MITQKPKLDIPGIVQLAKDGYAPTVHQFAKPGTYLVRVERTDRRGFTATARLKVVVNE